MNESDNPVVPPTAPDQARPVAVIGAGTLGRRIAAMFASRGGTVQVYDPDADQLRAALDEARGMLGQLVRERGWGEQGVIQGSDDLAGAVQGAWLVVEAAPERLDLKIALWGEISRAADADAVLTTNSSSFTSREMAENVVDRTRFLNMHFAMPPQAPAVDLMSDGETAPAVLEKVQEALPAFGLYPFLARRESTGFVFNRIWAAVKRESLAVVADGVASPEDVDAMFRLNWGLTSGPFQKMDGVGLDVVLDIENHYAQRDPNLPEGPRRLLREYVSSGRLGRKSGEGFYRYDTTGEPA